MDSDIYKDLMNSSVDEYNDMFFVFKSSNKNIEVHLVNGSKSKTYNMNGTTTLSFSDDGNNLATLVNKDDSGVTKTLVFKGIYASNKPENKFYELVSETIVDSNDGVMGKYSFSRS
ncbi:hypothetical protein K9L67_03565 [Candidatus Woesearchaeota archaeon]|nr:hypothetical protein [Candidatus Woesearchaeota archaeon]MCF7901279.1 hypothetical protein [Candidatus Woesearchaeota archaeon]MCF8013554.1 hypothetical protein [Candidatus Woesearchaeota archaeon]